MIMRAHCSSVSVSFHFAVSQRPRAPAFFQTISRPPSRRLAMIARMAPRLLSSTESSGVTAFKATLRRGGVRTPTPEA